VWIVPKISEPYGDHRDGVDIMVAEENRDGVMEYQEKHQLRLEEYCFELLFSQVAARNRLMKFSLALTVIAIMRQQITLFGVEACRSYS
jgi:hypothetical protein